MRECSFVGVCPFPLGVRVLLCAGLGSMCVWVRGEVSLGWPWLESWRRAEVKQEICRKDTHHFPHYYFFFFFLHYVSVPPSPLLPLALAFSSSPHTSAHLIFAPQNSVCPPSTLGPNQIVLICSCSLYRQKKKKGLRGQTCAAEDHFGCCTCLLPAIKERGQMEIWSSSMRVGQVCLD